jgi:hypothetical protein
MSITTPDAPKFQHHLTSLDAVLVRMGEAEASS